MKIYSEISLGDFNAWSGAVDTMNTLHNLNSVIDDMDVFESLESTIEEWNENGITDTELNDLLWFETDTIAEWLGFSDWEELERKASGEEDEED